MLIKNSIICKNCFQQITSHHRHEMVICLCGKHSIDGGLDYIKISGSDYVDSSIKSHDSHEKIRFNFEWGTRGEKGDSSLQYVKLCEMSSAHIANILEKQTLQEEIRKIFIDEFNFRHNKN